MKTEFISKVAEPYKAPTLKKKEIGSLETRQIADKVEISFQGKQKLNDASHITSAFERDRFDKVARIQEQIRTQHYDVNPIMVEHIANEVLKLVS